MVEIAVHEISPFANTKMTNKFLLGKQSKVFALFAFHLKNFHERNISGCLELHCIAFDFNIFHEMYLILNLGAVIGLIALFDLFFTLATLTMYSYPCVCAICIVYKSIQIDHELSIREILPMKRESDTQA